MTRTLAIVTLALAMLGTSAVPLAGAFHSDLPIAETVTGDGFQSWGVRVTNDAEADINIDMHGGYPPSSSRVTAGVVFFDADKQPTVMAAFTFLLSPDRTEFHPPPEQGPLEPAQVHGDASALEDVEFSVHTNQAGSDSDDPSAQAHCPAWFCVAVDLLDRDRGDHHLVVWMAGVDDTTMMVRGNAITDVATEPGEAYAIGDAELDDGAPNVQAQRTVCDERTDAPSCPLPGPTGASYDVKLGAKVIKDATIPIEGQDRLWGFWGALDFKLVCQLTVGICPDNVYQNAEVECSRLVNAMTGHHCQREDLDWDGPGDLGGDDRWWTYPILDGPPGDYSFDVNYMSDVWGPRVYDPTTGSWVFMGEYFVSLTLADAGLPD